LFKGGGVSPTNAPWSENITRHAMHGNYSRWMSIHEKTTDMSIRNGAVRNFIASDSKETLIKISEEKFDIILLYVQLPDMETTNWQEGFVRMAAQKIRRLQELLSARTGITNETTRSCG
jgi:hypothetical protein